MRWPRWRDLTVPAHHSFSTEYDRTKPVSVTGVVRKVEWKNPHIWFYVDVKDAGAGSRPGDFPAHLQAS